MSELVPFDYRDVEGIPASESREIRWTGITQWVLDRVHPTIEQSWQYSEEYMPLYWVYIHGKRYVIAEDNNKKRVLLFNGKPSYLHGIEDRHSNRCSDDNRIISHTDTETPISEVGRSVLLSHTQSNTHFARVMPVKCIDGKLSFMVEPPRNHHTIFWEAIVMWGKERVRSILGWSPNMQYQDQNNPVSVILQNGDRILLPSDKPLSALSIVRVCRR